VPQVAGGKDESVMQPLWGGNGELVFISDRSGFWNLYRRSASGQVSPVLQLDAEFGGPAWVFGMRSYQILPDGRCAGLSHGLSCHMLHAHVLWIANLVEQL
jgi:hypothetical protein